MADVMLLNKPLYYFCFSIRKEQQVTLYGIINLLLRQILHMHIFSMLPSFYPFVFWNIKKERLFFFLSTSIIQISKILIPMTF